MQQDYQMFKIVIIGSMGTGKTNISTRYIKNQYIQGQKSTVGVEFLSKVVQIRNQKIKVTLWDTAGQQRYKSLSKVYYKGASGILIVYDITQPQSYLDVQSWMRLANQNLNLNEVILMVVGNKIDLEDKRKVPSDRPLKQYKQKFDIDCWEVSAKTGFNVKQVFTQLLQKIYDMNLRLKGSHMPIDNFDDESYYGSVADGTFIKQGRKTLKQNEQLPPVSEEVDNQVNKNSIAPKKEGNGHAGEKKKNLKLTANQQDKKKNEKKKGCC